MSVDAMDLVKTQDRDAQKWAQSFIETVARKGLQVDESLMIGWFSNSMMAMHDSLYNDEIDVLNRKISKLKELILLTDETVSDVVIGKTQLSQWDEFCKCFPDELIKCN